MKNTNKLRVQKAKINNQLHSMSVGYEIDPKSGVSFLYGTLYYNEIEEDRKNLIAVTFRYAPAKYKEPLLLNIKVNSIKTSFTDENQKATLRKKILVMLNTLDDSVKKDLNVINPTNTKTNNNDITPVEGLDLNIPKQEATPTIEEKDNRDEVIKKLLEENANLREENKRLKDIINKNSKAKEEAVVTATEAFNADKLMAAMRKEFDKKLESLRKEMMDKLNTTTVVTTTKVEESTPAPIVETKKEEKPKALTAEELLATKELEDMTFQELQKIGKYFKIGAANNSPRPQLIEILKQHINPVIEEEKQPEIIEETVVTTVADDINTDDDIPELFEDDNTDELVEDTTETNDNTTSDLSDLQKELLADFKALLD